MKLGLIGKKLAHSFSKKYFEEKFEKENLEGYSYDLFELDSIEKLRELMESDLNLDGLNVTIPFKESVIPFVDFVDEEAQKIGAINTIKITRKGSFFYTEGFNTDVYGFRNSIKPFIKHTHERALILGTGGASKAIEFVLKNLGIDVLFVSRTPFKNQIGYEDVNENMLKHYKLIVNCTPLGMFPDIETCPEIPYQFLNETHTLIDLVYNPEKSLFLEKGEKQGTVILNGLSMLQQQAERSFEIWKN